MFEVYKRIDQLKIEEKHAMVLTKHSLNLRQEKEQLYQMYDTLRKHR